MINFHKAFCIFALFYSIGIFAANDENAVQTGQSIGTPPKIGNFALPTPQQPGPLLAFGQTLIGRNQLQLVYSTYSPYHVTGAFRNMNASLTYGFTDETSVFFNVPVASNLDIPPMFKDATLQLEHSIWAAGNEKYQAQTSVVAAMTLPIQELKLTDEIEGYRSPVYFLGGTYTLTYIDWFFFTSPGYWQTTTSHHVKIGSQWLYQAGIGHNICSVTDQSMLSFLLEMDGQYDARTQVFRTPLDNTGGNIVTLAPGFILAFRHLMVQVGVGLPVSQHLNGDQTKTDYFIAANFTWTVT